MYKISAESDVIVKSYRVYGRSDTLTDSRVYSLFEYTKTNHRSHLINDGCSRNRRGLLFTEI